MKFRLLPDIATADVAFEACGKTIEELFENCGSALEETMVDTETVSPITKHQLPMTNDRIEDLLYDFLSELIFLKDRDGLLFSKIKVKISNLPTTNYQLLATLYGEPIDPSRHHLRADVKAVTKHLFKIEKKKERYQATIVLDI